MASWSGIWDYVEGDTHALDAKHNPPQARGMIRALMQNSFMHGHVNALGRTAPATRTMASVTGETLTVKGGYDYANRQDDVANQVDITNMHGNDRAMVTYSRVTDATERDMAGVYDTTLRKYYAADASGNGGPEMTP